MTTDIIATYWPFLAGGLLAVVILLFILRGRRRQRVEISSNDAVVTPTLGRVARPDPIIAPVAASVADKAAALVNTEQADDLRLIKGLGPKVAARLSELGIVRFAQLASLDASDQIALDAKLGTFAGRMARDRWVDQAALLAADDRAAFEREFGKLG